MTRTRNHNDYTIRINGTWFLYLADKGKMYRAAGLQAAARMRYCYYLGCWPRR